MISIVIPLYNKAHTIVHTLNAVFKQEYQDFEVIIVDDGSTDNGVGIIQQHFHDNRIRIFHQENQGVSVARNRGVEEARCEYVALLDGDRMASRLSENHDQTYSKQPPMRIVSMCIYRSRCFSLYLLYTKRI